MSFPRRLHSSDLLHRVHPNWQVSNYPLHRFTGGMHPTSNQGPHRSRQSSGAAPCSSQSTGGNGSGSSRYWRDVLGSETPVPSTKSNSLHKPISQDPSKPASTQFGSDCSGKQRSSRNLANASSPAMVLWCEVCQRGFERRGHLEAHVQSVHEGKRLHTCPHGCGKTYGHESSLQRHVKQVHNPP